MIGYDPFVALQNPLSADAHRREAARIRLVAANVTTSAMRKHLEDRAQAHEQLAGREVADSGY